MDSPQPKRPDWSEGLAEALAHAYPNFHAWLTKRGLQHIRSPIALDAAMLAYERDNGPVS